MCATFLCSALYRLTWIKYNSVQQRKLMYLHLYQLLYSDLINTASVFLLKYLYFHPISEHHHYRPESDMSYSIPVPLRFLWPSWWLINLKETLSSTFRRHKFHYLWSGWNTSLAVLLLLMSISFINCTGYTVTKLSLWSIINFERSWRNRL